MQRSYQRSASHITHVFLLLYKHTCTLVLFSWSLHKLVWALVNKDIPLSFPSLLVCKPTTPLTIHLVVVCSNNHPDIDIWTLVPLSVDNYEANLKIVENSVAMADYKKTGSKQGLVNHLFSQDLIKNWCSLSLIVLLSTWCTFSISIFLNTSFHYGDEWSDGVKVIIMPGNGKN